MGEDFGGELEEERRQVETFRRIHRLYNHGFRPDWTVVAVEDAIWWKHPGGHPDLILFADGKLVASLEQAVLTPDDKHNKDRILNGNDADSARFDRWLASVKTPTLWQAVAVRRQRYIVMPLAFASVCGIIISVIWVVSKILGAIIG